MAHLGFRVWGLSMEFRVWGLGMGFTVCRYEYDM